MLVFLEVVLGGTHRVTGVGDLLPSITVCLGQNWLVGLDRSRYMHMTVYYESTDFSCYILVMLQIYYW